VLLYNATVLRLSSGGQLLSSFNVPSPAPFFPTAQRPQSSLSIGPGRSLYTTGAQLNAVSQLTA
jgi:hypothetical protein